MLLKLVRSTSSKPVKVIVGTGSKTKDFYVHEDELKRHSDFCAAALRGPWLEAQERVIRLPDEDPDVFAVFVDFIYGAGRIDITCGTTVSQTIAFMDSTFAAWDLGDRMLCTSLRDAVVDRFIGTVSSWSPRGVLLWMKAYAKANSSRGLKRLLVDVALWNWRSSDFQRAQYLLPLSPLLVETVLRARTISPAELKGKRPWVDAGCKYHDHGDDKPCYKTMF